MSDDFGVRLRQIILFAGVLLQIVEFIPWILTPDVQMDQFPRAFPDRLSAAEFLEFEIQVIMFLLSYLSSEQGKEADAVHSFRQT